MMQDLAVPPHPPALVAGSRSFLQARFPVVKTVMIGLPCSDPVLEPGPISYCFGGRMALGAVSGSRRSRAISGSPRISTNLNGRRRGQELALRPRSSSAGVRRMAARSVAHAARPVDAKPAPARRLANAGWPVSRPGAIDRLFERPLNILPPRGSVAPPFVGCFGEPFLGDHAPASSTDIAASQNTSSSASSAPRQSPRRLVATALGCCGGDPGVYPRYNTLRHKISKDRGPPPTLRRCPSPT